MKKKTFDVPLIFLTTAQPNDFGGYSETGELSIKPLPMRFDEWEQSRWRGDYDSNGEVDFNDFAKWWGQNGFSTDAFTEYTGQAWQDEWSF